MSKRRGKKGHTAPIEEPVETTPETPATMSQDERGLDEIEEELQASETELEEEPVTEAAVEAVAVDKSKLSHYQRNKASHAKYQASEKGKEARTRYMASDKAKATRASYHSNRRAALKLLKEAQKAAPELMAAAAIIETAEIGSEEPIEA